MALTTYAELQTAVANWLARDDLTSYIPDFVTLFEANANRRLRVRQMEATNTTMSFSSGSATLPTDYLLYRRFTNTTSTRTEMQYVTPSYLQAAYPTTPTGTPSIFTIEGTTIKVRPTGITTFEFDYYQKISALSGTVNWLFSAHPDIYLFGSLVEAEAFGVNDPRAAMWKTRVEMIYNEIENLDNLTNGGGSIRAIGSTP